MQDTTISLITRADDVGSFHSANLATLDACDNGICRNPSIMANGLHVDEAAEIFATRSDLCIGMHLTFTCEYDNVKWGPVLPPEQVPSLVDENGHMLKNPLAIHERGPVYSEMLAETQAQADKLRALGFNLEHVFCHMATEWVHMEDSNDRFHNHLRRWAEKEGLVFPPDIIPDAAASNINGIVSSEPAHYVDEVAAFLETVGPGLWDLHGHPGYDDEEFRSAKMGDKPGALLAAERNAERLVFSDPRIMKCCKERNIRILSFVEAAAEGLAVPVS